MKLFLLIQQDLLEVYPAKDLNAALKAIAEDEWDYDDDGLTLVEVSKSWLLRNKVSAEPSSISKVIDNL